MRKRLETRLALESAALDLALELGVEQVTVEQIAERANVSRRTFFNYFSSKEDALVGEPAGGPDLADLATLGDGAPGDNAPGFNVFADLKRLIGQHIRSLSESDALLERRMLVLSSHPELAVRHLGRLAKVFDSITDEVSRRLAYARPSQPSAITRQRARMLLHLCATVVHHGIDEYRRDPGAGDLAGAIERSFDTLEFVKEHYL